MDNRESDVYIKTIREIAEEIGVSKQAVFKKINRQPLSTELMGLTATVDGRLMVSVDGEKLIKQAFCAENVGDSRQPSTKTVNHQPSTVNQNRQPSTRLTVRLMVWRRRIQKRIVHWCLQKKCKKMILATKVKYCFYGNRLNK